MAAGSLVAYAAGLVGFVAVKVLAPGHYARREQRAPVRCAMAALAVNLLLSLLLVQPLAHVGLALATSLAALVNAALLGWSLVRHGVYRPEPGWPWLLARVGAGCIALAAVLAAFTPAPEIWLAWGGLQRAGRLTLLVAAGAFVYFGAVWAAGLRPRHLRAPR
jgi:putative peptidoglycan lipid II flippase